MDTAQRKRISKAYDAAISDPAPGRDSWADIPEEFLNSAEFAAFQKDADPKLTGSAAPDIKAFLAPAPGLKLLDAGCCADLAAYRLDRWASTYYGVDISPKIIEAMRTFATKEDIAIGGLEVAEVTTLPFPDQFFDIALCIGVIEYVDLEYTRKAIGELHRVLRQGGRMVIDIPNLDHPLVNVMFALENYLGRPHIIKSHRDFEEAVAPFFNTMDINDRHSMRKYFLKST
jgi:ubiquinone/menaquinone biosynthesis C-methylase UbiE